MADLLVSVDALELRLGRAFTTAQADRAEAVLADVSATIRAYLGQQITIGEGTVHRSRVKNGGVRLPQRPVVEVTEISTVDGDPVTFTWQAGPTVAVDASEGTWLDVTYTHGWDEVPGDIVAVVCSVAGRAFGMTADQGGMASESIGTYSYTIGAAAAAGPAGLLNDERAVLDRYRVVGGTARVGP